MKFGGALMKDAQGITRVGELIEEFSCEPLVVIVSAIGKTTNALESLWKKVLTKEPVESDFHNIKIHHLDIYNELFPQGNKDLSEDLSTLFDELWLTINEDYENRYEAYDNIVSVGEELASCLNYYYLLSRGIKTRLLSSKCLIKTDSNYTDAEVNWEYTSKTISTRVIPAIENKEVIITQGFIGADGLGKTTTLGREGSDFTAAIFGNIIDADEVTIWKNVPGLMNADPALNKDAVVLDSLSYHEAIELAYYGASVIHPKTIQPLKVKNIPLLVRPYYDLLLKPTRITNDTTNDNAESSIIVKDNQTLLSISTQNLSFIAESNLKQIFEAFSKNKTHINLMQNSAVSFSVCFNADPIKVESIIDQLKHKFDLRYNTGLQLFTVRHYDDQLVDSLIGNSKVYLVQKSRVTVQILLKK